MLGGYVDMSLARDSSYNKRLGITMLFSQNYASL